MLLGQPEFKALHWTSLQPNLFTTMGLNATAEFMKEFKKTWKQGPLSMMMDASTPAGLIDPYDVGVTAAHLLAQEDTNPHNNAKHVLNGPEDVTGEQVVKMADQYTGESVKEIRFKDVAFVDQMAENFSESKNVICSINLAPVTTWEGKAKAETTSKEILDLYAPKWMAADVLTTLVDG
jgi:hypothetical protein